MASSSSVQSIFETILQRPADPGEILTFLDDSVTDGAVAAAIAASPGALAEPATVIRIYEAVFGRKPDVAGLNYWVDRLTSEPGFDVYKMADFFVSSKEFSDRYGATVLDTTGAKQALIEAIYKNVLARTPDAEGLKFWMGTDYTPGQLLVLFAQSKEFVARAAPEIQEFFVDVAIDGGSDPSNSDADDYSGSIFDTKAGTVTISVEPTITNSAPVSFNGGSEVAEDKTLNGKVPTATDAENNALTYSVVTAPTKGTLSLNPDGSFTYTPNKDYNGPDSFKYVANDGQANSNVSEFKLTVTPVNDAPTIADRTFTIAEDNFFGGNFDGIDVDGDKIKYSPFSGTNYQSFGTGGPDLFSFVPAKDFVGIATATFVADDSKGGITKFTYTFNVTPTPDAAVIGGTTTGTVVEAMPTDAGTPTATGDLTIVDPDDGEAFFVENKSGVATYGTFTVTKSGTWTYTLDNTNKSVDDLPAGGTLTDTFKVKSVDTTEKVITITINGVNETKTAPDPVTGTGDGKDRNDTMPGGLSGSGNNDVIQGTTGDDKGASTLDGQQGNDRIFGRAGNDSILGGESNDKLFGGSGNDTIDGEQGNDTIVGGYGADSLTGGSGSDVFVLSSTNDTGDRITDFSVTDDKIGFADDLAGKLTFSNLAIVTVGGNTVVNVDVPGGSATQYEMQVTLTGTVSLTAANFNFNFAYTYL